MTTGAILAAVMAVSTLAAEPGAEIRQLGEIQRTLNSADPSQLIHEQFSLIDTDGQWYDRSGFLAQTEVRLGDPGEPVDQQIRLYGDAAIVATIARDNTRWLRSTTVYSFRDGRWWLVSLQRTAVLDASAIAKARGAPATYPRWQGQDPTGDDQQALGALNDQYVAAFRRADVSWYDAHLAPDYTVVSGSGRFEDRAAALADFKIPYFANGIRSFPVDKVTTTIIGRLGLARAENAYELKDGRRGINRYTDVWIKQDDDRWLCVSAHITVLKAPSH
jgi:ketosteroid isomerase-like protein